MALSRALVGTLTPAYAHPAGEAHGVESNLLLMAVGTIVAGVVIRMMKREGSEAPWRILLALGICLLAAAIIVPA